MANCFWNSYVVVLSMFTDARGIKTVQPLASRTLNPDYVNITLFHTTMV
jgi:hypothetical protein